MSKEITMQTTNKLNIVGKLLDKTIVDGTSQDGRKYERANITVRVTQTYNGQEETSEIPISMFAFPVTNSGKANPAWDSIQQLKAMKSVQEVGNAEASVVRMTGATLRENNFVSRNSGQIINGWQINNSFINATNNAKDIASFNLDIFIMDMMDEMDRDGDPTGRLIIKGGIVQYGGRLDVLEFVVEGADKVDYLQRNWNINDTVNAGGRIRVTSQEEKRSASTSSWGEELPETSTRVVRELIITTGSDEGFEEDFAYDASDIKKAFNVRKANLEQLQIDAKKGSAPKAAQEATSGASKYSWE